MNDMHWEREREKEKNLNLQLRQYKTILKYKTPIDSFKSSFSFGKVWISYHVKNIAASSSLVLICHVHKNISNIRMAFENDYVQTDKQIHQGMFFLLTFIFNCDKFLHNIYLQEEFILLGTVWFLFSCLLILAVEKSS